MKVRKFILPIIFVAALLFISGCGDGSDEKKEQSKLDGEAKKREKIEVGTKKESMNKKSSEKETQGADKGKQYSQNSDGESKQISDEAKQAKKKEIRRSTNIPNVIGTYTGTFDKQPTTLQITEQNGSEFNGKITINYSNVINKDVKGKIDKSAGKFTMVDLQQRGIKGKYRGSFDFDKGVINGTFIKDSDGSRWNFSLMEDNEHQLKKVEVRKGKFKKRKDTTEKNKSEAESQKSVKKKKSKYE